MAWGASPSGGEPLSSRDVESCRTCFLVRASTEVPYCNHLPCTALSSVRLHMLAGLVADTAWIETGLNTVVNDQISHAHVRRLGCGAFMWEMLKETKSCGPSREPSKPPCALLAAGFYCKLETASREMGLALGVHVGVITHQCHL